MPTTIIYKQRPHSDTQWDAYHPGLEIHFSRITAGIGWPDEKPGAIVVLGEQLVLPAREAPNIHWLAEFESFDLGELLQKAVEFKNDLKVQTFYAGASDATNDFTRYFNQSARRNRTHEIHIHRPPNFKMDGCIGYHINLLKEILRSESKRLLLGAQSRLPGLLQEMPNAVTRIAEKDFPMMTALAYAACPLVLYPYLPESPNRALDRCRTEYDVFG
jgi:hypothetical protein